MFGKTSRRKFLKTTLFAVGGLAAALVDVKFDASEGIQTGQHHVAVGVAGALAKCGSAYDCSGGGGTCGSAYECSGGGGKCGSSYDCSGGGGKCGSAYECSGG